MDKIITDKIFMHASQVLWTFWDIDRLGYYQTTYYFNGGSLMNIDNINFGNEFENDDKNGEELYGIVITDGEQSAAHNFDELNDDQFLIALIMMNNPLKLKNNPDLEYVEPQYCINLDYVKNGEKFLAWAQSEVLLESVSGTD